MALGACSVTQNQLDESLRVHHITVIRVINAYKWKSGFELKHTSLMPTLSFAVYIILRRINMEMFEFMRCCRHNAGGLKYKTVFWLAAVLNLLGFNWNELLGSCSNSRRVFTWKQRRPITHLIFIDSQFIAIIFDRVILGFWCQHAGRCVDGEMSVFYFLLIVPLLHAEFCTV